MNNAKIIVYVKSMEEEWEQTFMPAKCLSCYNRFELDTEQLDLEDEDPIVTCPNCHHATTMTLVETLPVEGLLE